MKLWKKLAIGAVTLASLVTYSSSFVVKQPEHAVITRFGNPKRVVVNPIEKTNRTKEIIDSYAKEGVSGSEGPGLYLFKKIPLIDSVNKIDRRLLALDGLAEEFPTKDKKYINIADTSRYIVEDPLIYFKSLRTETTAASRLSTIIDEASRNSISNRDLSEIVRTSNRVMQVTEKELVETVSVGRILEGREVIAREICETAGKKVQQYGIGIHSNGYLITDVVYVESVKQKVEDRMISERTRVAAKYISEGEGEYQNILGSIEREQKRIMSLAYKQAQEIKGAADANAVKIYADAYSKNPEFYAFSRTLEAYEKALNQGTRVMIGTDNDFLGLLKGQTNKATPVTQTQK